MAAKLTAVLGNCKRTGRWKIRSHTKALVLFGNCKIDYRDAYADDELEEIKLDVMCLFGRAVFILPPGANVQPSAVSLLSSSRFDVEVTNVDADLPSIKMESTTVFGMCRVQTIDDTTAEEVEIEVTPTSEERQETEPVLATDTAAPPLPPPAMLGLSIDPALSTSSAPSLPPTEIAMGNGPEVSDPSPSEHHRIDDLDPKRAVLITEETETVHIAAGVPDSVQ